MRKIRRSGLLLGIVGFYFLVGCATGPHVSRVETGTVTDISGRWNDTDSRLVAEEMVKDALSRPWLDKFSKGRGKPPTVIVGTVVNRSTEHINVQTFIKDLERELINSGQVEFVAAKGEREEIREERKEQALHSTEETQKGPGKETGADYMLKGVLNSIPDEAGGIKAMFYQVDLELFDMANNKKVWGGQKKIKKVIERKRLGF
ncbi:MAG TPA: penicillin-binding protein activator LpoB [Nitrospiria bacterium]|nr:penicillin-binding protein activator LpoB [Nitrospiria bacterium]